MLIVSNTLSPLANVAYTAICDVLTEGTGMADKILDAKGLNCPLPILKAKRALQDLAHGGTLEIWATDPGSVADFNAFCRATGHILRESDGEGGVYRFVIERA